MSEPAIVIHILDAGRKLCDSEEAHGRQKKRREVEGATDEQGSDDSLKQHRKQRDAALSAASLRRHGHSAKAHRRS
jgi:hypothetical protein